MRRLAAPLFLALLALAPAAHAGGWATYGLSGAPTGRDWTPTVTLLQHGQTPLDGVSPAIIVETAEGSTRFAGTPTGQPGKYRFKVRFPEGTSSYSLDDGFTQTHYLGEFNPSGAPAPATAASRGSTPAAADAGPVVAADSSGAKRTALIVGGAGVLVIVLMAGWLLRRERRAAPPPAQQPRGASTKPLTP